MNRRKPFQSILIALFLFNLVINCFAQRADETEEERKERVRNLIIQEDIRLREEWEKREIFKNKIIKISLPVLGCVGLFTVIIVLVSKTEKNRKPINNQQLGNVTVKKFCLKCGQQIMANDKFCIKCGEKIEATYI